MEGGRLRALEMYEQGWEAIRIAESLGVTRGAVSQWLKAARVVQALEVVEHRRGPRCRTRRPSRGS